LISAVAWLLITSPPSKLRRVPEAIALHVLVSNLNHKLNSQRLPRQILPRTPATLRARYPFRKIITRPFFPRMIGERVLPVRLQKLHQLDALLIGKTRAHTNVLQVARVVVESQQQRSDTIAVTLFVPAETSHDA